MTATAKPLPNRTFRSNLDGARILVTGGTGSMGKVLVHKLLKGEHGLPEKVIVFSRDEAKQHDMRVALTHPADTSDANIYDNFHKRLEFRTGDVRDYADVVSAMSGVDIVVNGAALKQVPNCEYFAHQAVLTNCIGANNIVRAIIEARLPVQTVVGISTDKAAKPVNVMGMTKAIQERIFAAANILAPTTRFVAVRYGNVMASRGSVVPLFHHQIASGGPVTVTVPDMTRFLLSIDEAVETVFAALAMADPGEILVPNAKSATVIDIAKALIGDRPIDIKIIGPRPGEKMHEVMITEEECRLTVPRGDYYGIMSMLPELGAPPAVPALADEFSSEHTVLGLDQTIQLLRKHRLMVDQVDANEELIR